MIPTYRGSATAAVRLDGREFHIATVTTFARKFPFAEWARRMGLRRRHIAICMVLPFLVALADGVMLALLVPLGRGVGTGDFSSFWRFPLVARVLPYPRDFATGFLILAACMFALALVKNSIAHLQHTVVGRLREKYARNLGNSLFTRFLGFGKAYFDQTSVGQLSTTLDYRHDAVAMFLAFVRLTSISLVLLAYLGVMLLISWKLTLLAFLVFPAVQLASRSILRHTAATARAIKQATVDLGKHVHSALSTITLYQTFSREGEAREEFASVEARLGAGTRRLWQLRGISFRIQELTALMALLVMLALSFWLERGRASQGAIMLVFFFIARLSLPMLAALPEILLDASEALPRVQELLRVFEDNDKHIVPDGSRPFAGLSSEIRFDHLDFRYPSGTHALVDASFTIPKGSMTALVGPSGAGKSTVIQVLLRFYDVPASTVFLDGVDIREFDIHSLRRGVALVSQDATLLPGTLRSNLLFGVDEPVSERQLRQIVEETHLTELVDSQPAGLDLIVGEHAATLSGGQRQRVAIARALLRRAQLLILDEPTSAVDVLTEHLLHETVVRATRDATVLVVAHRFATIQRADHVIVLEEGRVVEQGTVETLLQQRQLFHRMWQVQKFA